MKRLGLLLRKYWAISVLFTTLAIVYIVQVLTSSVSPATQAKYHASAGQIHKLGLAVAVPYIVIWIVGLVGYLWLHSYTTYLGKDKDASGFRVLTRGVFLLTFWLPFSTLVGNLASSYYTTHPSSTATLVRLVNYVNILLLLPAFWWLYQGANQLLASAKIHYSSLTTKQIALFLAFSAVYVFLTFQDPVRATSADGVAKATYYLSDWWILLTLVIPRLIMWYLGFSAAASIILYRRKVKGKLYKDALRWVSLGLVGIVSSTIVLRIVQSLTTQLAKLSLLVLFLVVYALLAIIAVGYVLLAKGASRLQKIEEL
jgi:hypothetical protein